VDRAAECARCAESDIVEENHEDVRCAGRRTHGLDRGNLVFGSLAS
jgi:hypothetical protein